MEDHSCVEEHDLLEMWERLSYLLDDLPKLEHPVDVEISGHSAQFIYDSIYLAAIHVGNAFGMMGKGEAERPLMGDPCHDLSSEALEQLRQSASFKRLGAVFDELVELAETTRPVVKARY